MGRKADDFLNELTRAQDILLGALGIDGDTEILALEICDEGYAGTARWPDGETCSFEADWEPDELERWALDIVLAQLSAGGLKAGNAES